MSTDAPAVPADDAAWPTQSRSTRISVRPLTALLTVALIAICAVYAGARLEQRERGTTAASSGFPTTPFGARTRGSGATGALGAAGGGTTGTVTQVSRKLLYLTSSTGALVKVRLTAKTTFTRTAASPTGGLALGDTAVVRGAKDASGVLVATSVIATAKGVTSTFAGGFDRFGGGAATGG
jgi:hypothetical protein